uniref:Uncharacterized protein n=1 Tax=Arundo donax TaxID=35708 RepID=A0A0A8ZCX1_ARUDO
MPTPGTSKTASRPGRTRPSPSSPRPIPPKRRTRTTTTPTNRPPATLPRTRAATRPTKSLLNRRWCSRSDCTATAALTGSNAPPKRSKG